MKENPLSILNLQLFETALSDDQKSASLAELCQFLELDVQEARLDSVQLITRSFTILENPQFVAIVDQEQQLRLLKAASEIVGLFFMAMMGIPGNNSNLPS